LIDDITGFFVGEVAEAYLHSTAQFTDKDTSVIALVVDRIDAYRSVQGEPAVERIMAQVARSIRATAATVGVIAAAYRNGIIVLIAPEYRAKPAKALGESLHTSVAGLAIENVEAIAADHVTVSVAVITGRVDHWVDLTHLLTRAISVVREVSALGGDRLVAADA
jgi:GGDEF domain-containing protein